MKKIVAFAVIFASTFGMLYVFDKASEVNVVATSDANSATVVTTDGFGNKQTCETTIVGSNVYSHCD